MKKIDGTIAGTEDDSLGNVAKNGKQQESKVEHEDIGKDRFMLSGAERFVLARFIALYIKSENEKRGERGKSLDQLSEEGIAFWLGKNAIRITSRNIQKISQVIESNRSTYPKEEEERKGIAISVRDKVIEFASIPDLRENFKTRLRLNSTTDAELIFLLSFIRIEGFTDGLMAYLNKVSKGADKDS